MFWGVLPSSVNALRTMLPARAEARWPVIASTTLPAPFAPNAKPYPAAEVTGANGLVYLAAISKGTASLSKVVIALATLAGEPPVIFPAIGAATRA